MKMVEKDFFLTMCEIIVLLQGLPATVAHLLQLKKMSYYFAYTNMFLT